MRPPLQSNYVALPTLVKDLKEVLTTIPDVEIKTITARYLQGFVLGLPAKPVAIELINCRNTKFPEALTNFGSAVEFTWGVDGAEILRIEGLSIGDTTYTFTFRVSYGG